MCFNVERFVKTQRFFNKNRPKRCLPYCSGMDPAPQVSPLSLTGHDVGVRIPPLPSSQCPSNIYQVAQTSGGPAEKDGDKANHLPRRHFDYVRIQGKSSRAHYCDSQPTF